MTDVCIRDSSGDELEIRHHGGSYRNAAAIHRTGDVCGEDLSADGGSFRLDDCRHHSQSPVRKSFSLADEETECAGRPDHELCAAIALKGECFSNGCNYKSDSEIFRKEESADRNRLYIERRRYLLSDGAFRYGKDDASAHLSLIHILINITLIIVFLSL